MIEDFLTWLAQLDLINLNSLVTLKSSLPILNSKSDLFVFVIYIATFRKTYAYCMGFFFCVLLNDNAFFGLINYALAGFKGEQHDVWYGFLWWCGLSLTWILFIIPHLIFTRNKSLYFWCGTMIIIQILMAWDWYANTYNDKSFLSENYTGIAVCIHVCICLSFYNPRQTIDAITDSVYRFRVFAMRFFVVSYFWYTVWSGRNYQRLLCQIQK